MATAVAAASTKHGGMMLSKALNWDENRDRMLTHFSKKGRINERVRDAAEQVSRSLDQEITKASAKRFKTEQAEAMKYIDIAKKAEEDLETMIEMTKEIARQNSVVAEIAKDTGM
jgi:GTPase SAR1 family protein